MWCYWVVVVIWGIPSADDVLCTQVEVTITDASTYNFVCGADVDHFLKKNNIYPVGKAMKEIDMREMEKQLLSNAALRRADCYRAANGTLQVKVSQRIPVFRVMSGTGSYYVDKERKTMPTILRHTAYVPIVTGSVNRQFACEELYDFIVYLQSNNFLRSQFSQIHVYPNNDVELIPRVGSQTIYVGDLENYESTMNKLTVFYKNAMPKVGWYTDSQIKLL